MNRAAVYRATLRHFFAPVADLLYDDESVTEVMINGPDRIYFERGGRVHESDRRFESEAALEAAVRNLADRSRRSSGSTPSSPRPAARGCASRSASSSGRTPRWNG
jgi:type IV secretory pathway ATPase VirB11/archaellum biosynthesis ATPase